MIRWIMLDSSKPSAADINRTFYGTTSSGRDDYWSKMAGPRYRLNTILGLLEEQVSASTVDLGCGNGQLLMEIHKRYPGMELCGIDLSSAQIDANRLQGDTAHWYAMDLNHPVSLPPALVGRFETVIASEIVEHLDDPATFLRNALALGSPGRARLLLSTQSGRIRETEKMVGHQRHFSQEEMRRTLQIAGWEPIRIWNSGFPFHDMSKWLANLNPDASMRRFLGHPYGPIENFMCLALRLAFRFNSQRRGAQLFAVARRPVAGPEASTGCPEA